MPLISENITGNPKLLRKMEYGKVRDFIRVRPVMTPSIPLDMSTWKMKSFVMPSHYRSYAMEIEKLEIRQDDIWVLSFPKAGSTWVQEMVWLINNNFDFVGGQRQSLQTRFPFMEFSAIIPMDNKIFKVDTIAKMRRMESPRFIHSHLPVTLLPKQIWSVRPKMIYIARNPKDLAISYYHHCKNLQGYRGSLNDFLEIFLNDLVPYAPFHDHVLDYWGLKDEENVLFLTYEEMKRDLKNAIRKISDFFGRTPTDDLVDELANHLSFESMRDNPSVNFEEEILRRESFGAGKRPDPDFQFFRKGQIGTFQDEMSEELIAKFDEWTKISAVERDTDFQFEI